MEGFYQMISNRFKHYHAGMTITMVAVPGIMIAVTFISYIFYMHPYEHSSLLPHPSSIMGSTMCVLLGITLGFLGWIILALMAQSFASIDRANPTIYHELRSRFEALQPQIKDAMEYIPEITKNDNGKGDGNECIHRRREFAIGEMKQYCSRLKEALGNGDKEPPKRVPEVRDWIQGYGYVNLWEQLNRLDELLILFRPVQSLINDAFEVRLCLRGSPIDNLIMLNARLQTAERSLAQRHGLYYESSGTECSSPSGQPPMDDFTAREAMLKITRMLNEFRDERRTGLVRARNQLLKTITLSSFVIFTLLVSAILAEIHTQSLLGAAAFFGVGAVMGLFSRLRLNTSSKISTEDFGLANARLLHIPLLSGLAALGGVFITPLLAGIAATHGPSPLLTLKQIFDIGASPFSLVLAAIFGLSPSVLITRLQQEADQYKTDLKSTGPTTRRVVA
jgi:hypothetical protein